MRALAEDGAVQELHVGAQARFVRDMVRGFVQAARVAATSRGRPPGPVTATQRAGGEEDQNASLTLLSHASKTK